MADNKIQESEIKKKKTYMRGMRIFLLLCTLYSIIQGVALDNEAQSVMHQIYAGQAYIRAAMFFCTLCLIEFGVYISKVFLSSQK